MDMHVQIVGSRLLDRCSTRVSAGLQFSLRAIPKSAEPNSYSTLFVGLAMKISSVQNATGLSIRGRLFHGFSLRQSPGQFPKMLIPFWLLSEWHSDGEKSTLHQKKPKIGW